MKKIFNKLYWLGFLSGIIFTFAGLYLAFRIDSRRTETAEVAEVEGVDMKRVSFEDAYKYLRIKKDLLKNTYSFFSLHGHPSYLALIQFQDAFKSDYRADLTIMAPHATQCVLAFMSIFIVDYMKLVPEIKAMYDKLEEPRRFAIGMYEDAMRGEKKFQ